MVVYGSHVLTNSVRAPAFQDEFLYGTLLSNVAECRVLCEGYRREYNTERPHQSLKYLTPIEFKQQWLKNRSKTTGD